MRNDEGETHEWKNIFFSVIEGDEEEGDSVMG